MKLLIISMIIPFFFISSFVQAQATQGDWELSLSGYLGSIKNSIKVTTPYNHYEDEGKAQSYILLALRSGYYLSKEFEIEPEILWTAQENFPPAFALTANIAYNFNIPNSKVTPFMLIGYGYANGLPLTERLLGRSSDKLDIGCFNAGAGLKIFLAEPVVLRLEYRYQTYNQEISGSSYSYERTSTFHTLLIGFSFLL
jgi:opacity protein-like surface antigen